LYNTAIEQSHNTFNNTLIYFKRAINKSVLYVLSVIFAEEKRNGQLWKGKI